MKWALAFHLAFGPQPAAQHDSWLGADKIKHFFMSAFIECVAYGGLRTVRVAPGPALATAAGLTVAVGVGKEVHDVKAEGMFSLGDLTWDVAGAGVAALALNYTYIQEHGQSSRRAAK